MGKMHHFVFLIVYFFSVSQEQAKASVFDFQTCVDRLRSIRSCMEPSFVLQLACHFVRFGYRQRNSSFKNITEVKGKPTAGVPECQGPFSALLERSKRLQCFNDARQTLKSPKIIVSAMDKWYYYSLHENIWKQIHVSPLPRDFVVDERKGRIYLLMFYRKLHQFRIETTTSINMSKKVLLCVQPIKEGYPVNLARDHKLRVLFVTVSIYNKNKVNIYKITESKRTSILLRRLNSKVILSLTVNPKERGIVKREIQTYWLTIDALVYDHKDHVVRFLCTSRSRFQYLASFGQSSKKLQFSLSRTNWKTAVCFSDESIIFLGSRLDIYDRKLHYTNVRSHFPGRFVPIKAVLFPEAIHTD